jgi:hypothetical protein
MEFLAEVEVQVVEVLVGEEAVDIEYLLVFLLLILEERLVLVLI